MFGNYPGIAVLQGGEDVKFERFTLIFAVRKVFCDSMDNIYRSNPMRFAIWLFYVTN